MIPLLPRMSDDDIRAYALAREMPLVIDDSVPLYQVDEGEEGYSTARRIGYATMPGAIHIHPERVVEFHLRTLASVMIIAASHGWHSTKTA